MIGNHLRNLRRWNQIVQVLASHGFAGFLGEIGLGDTVASLLDKARIGHDDDTRHVPDTGEDHHA